MIKKYEKHNKIFFKKTLKKEEIKVKSLAKRCIMAFELWWRHTI